MDIQNIVALALVTVAGAYLGRSLWKVVRGRGGCRCGCDGTAGAEANAGASGLRRRPLVPPDGVGRPYPPDSEKALS